VNNRKIAGCFQNFAADLGEFARVLANYLHRRLFRSFYKFESAKDVVVGGLVSKRGKYVRPFLHSSMTGLILIGLALAPFLQSALPQDKGEAMGIGGAVLGNTTVAEAATTTQISIKPRDSVVTYLVQPGDTVSGIAQKFGISTDTIRWQNDLKSIEAIKPGQKLGIPPVSGVVHKVKRGETIYSIAKKYSVDAQAVVNWPFNNYTDDEIFALAVGQLLIVPDGIKPDEVLWDPTSRLAIRQTPDAGAVSPTGQFIWPASGQITQYFRWYHPAIDIANKGAPDALAADSGTVIVAGMPDRWGYGIRVIIDHGNGFQTLYAHLQSIYVQPGQTVTRGSAIGKMGSSGRSSGIHLHFEIRKNGVAHDPLGYL